MIIYKYQVQPNAVSRFHIDKRSKVLCMQTQNGQLNIWVVHPDDAVMDTPRDISVWGTGIEMPNERVHYIGTCQAGPFVFHAFEILPEISGI